MSSSQKPFRGMQINRSHPLAKGLVGAWVMNEGTGDKVFDLSGNGNNGTNNGADWNVNGGLDFNGTSDYVNCGNNDILSFGTNPFSIVASITPKTMTSTNSIVAKVLDNSPMDGEWHFSTLSNDVLYFQCFDASTTNRIKITGTQSLNVNQTNHVAAINSGGTSESALDLYLNSIIDPSPTKVKDGTYTGMNNYSTDVTIGMALRDSAYDSWMDGQISYVYIYNRALSEDEIAFLNREPYAMFEEPVSPALFYYEALSNGIVQAPWPTMIKPFRGIELDKTHPLARELIGCWVFNEKTGNTVFDLSGNGNSGTLVGTPDWTYGGLDFDGANDRISVADDSSITDIFDGGGTIVVLFKADTRGENLYGRLIQKGTTNTEGFELYMNPTLSGNYGKLRLKHNFNTTSGTWEQTSYLIPVGTNETTHFAVTYDNSAIANDPINYINGISVAVSEIGTPSGTRVSDSSEVLYIGDRDSFDRCFDGIIYYIMLWDRILTAEEVAWLNREPYAMFQPLFIPFIYDAAAPSGIMPLLLHLYNLMRG